MPHPGAFKLAAVQECQLNQAEPREVKRQLLKRSVNQR